MTHAEKPVSAAKAKLEIGIKATEMEQLEERIEDLEKIPSMKNIKHRITKMEGRVIPAPPAVICATSHEDADRQLAAFRKQYGDHIGPVVLIVPDIIKTE